MDQFKQFLPPKRKSDSDDCTECGHKYVEHKVYPGGKCAKCCDPVSGFTCNGFNLGSTIEYTDEEDQMTGKPWKISYVQGKTLKNGTSPKDRL